MIHRPVEGPARLQVFRRSKGPVETARFQLRGLEPDGTCTLVNMDTPSQRMTATGRELQEAGLRVASSNRPEAVIYSHTKQQP